MTSYIIEPDRAGVAGEVGAPGDKSIGHRAAILAALASGEVSITGMGRGEDNRRSLGAAEALGAEISARGCAGGGEALRVHGVGLDGLAAPRGPIDCGNAGTAMRLLAGILAGQNFGSELVGDASLSRRPMRRIGDPLTAMGASVTGREGQRPGEIYPPLSVRGPRRGRLAGLDWTLDVASAQVKSAILLAGLFAEGAVSVSEPGPTRDHTERMLAYLGAPVSRDKGRVTLDPAGWDRRLEPRPLAVPGDPSAAAFAVAAGLVAGGGDIAVRGVCVNDTRTGFFDALATMGARIERRNERHEGGEPVADLHVPASAGEGLRGAEIGGDVVVRAIDEIPILAVVAARAAGDTDFRDAEELRYKESDRIATTTEMLRGFGVEVEEHAGGFRVRGRGAKPLAPARVDAAGDHRIAMSAAVAALAADGPTRVDDVDNVATSFPEFPAALGSLGAQIRTVD